MRRIQSISALLILLTLSCTGKRKSEISLDGMVFEFVRAEPFDMENLENAVQPEMIAFVDESHFILVYFQHYSDWTNKGRYLRFGKDVILIFTSARYESIFPELPATSAPDTNHYEPQIKISDEDMKRFTLSYLTDNHTMYWPSGKGGFIGTSSRSIAMEDFMIGLSHKGLEFLLKNE